MTLVFLITAKLTIFVAFWGKKKMKMKKEKRWEGKKKRKKENDPIRIFVVCKKSKDPKTGNRENLEILQKLCYVG